MHDNSFSFPGVEVSKRLSASRDPKKVWSSSAPRPVIARWPLDTQVAVSQTPLTTCYDVCSNAGHLSIGGQSSLVTSGQLTTPPGHRPVIDSWPHPLEPPKNVNNLRWLWRLSAGHVVILDSDRFWRHCDVNMTDIWRNIASCTGECLRDLVMRLRIEI